jgi:uncharacterized repeat protein (TIGR03803 family)
MRGKRSSISLRAALGIFSVTLLVTSTWAATQEKVLHNFGKGTDGSGPVASLIFDSAGNLYGTAEYGGPYNYGMVFELTPKAGGWTEKVLHTFNNNGKDGGNPAGGLIFDSAGNLYGATAGGGVYGSGTVFELAPKTGGGWTEKVLHSFNNNGKDGTAPQAGVIFDAVGNLYGTCSTGGAYGIGTVFELAPKVGGGWAEKVLHTFKNNYKDGASPYGGLVLDAVGNLYGTTKEGGAYGVYGTVFELTPKTGGGWTEKVLHSFNQDGKDGYGPEAGLIFDAAGNLYGTTVYGGIYLVGQGTVFKLTPKTGGGWTEKILSSFGSGSRDAVNPYTGLILDAAGNLYGTTYYGGENSEGTVFKLTPQAGGGSKKTLLYSFNSSGDGINPRSSLIFDVAGNLYGTTYFGGADHHGTVFEITP